MILEKLESKIKKCKKCRLYKKSTNAVCGEGPKTAKVMLIGQNPGQLEDLYGKPFIGKSGKFLDKTFKKFTLKREDFYITSVVKHKTPKNRAPKEDEIKACLPYLISQIKIIKPKIIVLMGNIAKKYTPIFSNIIYIQTYHPASAMRFPKTRKVFERDFKRLKKIL